MCGIAGFYSTVNPLPEFYLREMAMSLQHRGPDASGSFYDGTAGLAHRRLSIIDLSDQANQPMMSASGMHAIVFNGEIYNYRELAAKFQINQRTRSDTEILVELFERYGPRFIEHVNGMFAMAVYSLADKKLYLFRDRLGIKPLFYAINSDDFYFASEIKALRKISPFSMKMEISPASLAYYLHLGFVPEPFTIYKNISKFPAGHFACVEGGKINLFPYWKAGEKITARKNSDYRESKKELKELLESSVRMRLISDVPYGTFLSGGIDSSLITAIACQVDSKPINTFTIGFKEDRINEAEYAKKIARHLKTIHHEFYVSHHDALQLIPKLQTMFDEPFADSSAIPTFLVSKLARGQVTMTLSGDGGDELFMGYGAHRWAKRLANPLVRLAGSWPSEILSLTGSKGKRAAWMFKNSDQSLIKSHILSQEMYFFSRDEVQILTGNKQVDWLHINPSFNHLLRKLKPEEQQALYDLQFYLKDDLLVKVDRASMQNSLENRVPFLDYRVVEFALNQPVSAKLEGKTAKRMLKDLLEDYLPRDLFDRPKQGFSVPLNAWMKNELRDYCMNYLSDNTLLRYQLVDPAFIKKIMHDYYTNKHAYLYLRLWQIVVLHHWAEQNTVI